MHILRRISLAALLMATLYTANAQEKIFAGYFDIATGSAGGTEVTGKIHLERNKDARTAPIPKTYHFDIARQDGNLFSIATAFDPAGRITGILTTTQKIKNTGDQQLTIGLKDGPKTISEFPITIKMVKETLWQTLFSRYKDITLTGASGRMFGRRKPKDAEVEKTIALLEAGKGEFTQFGFYHVSPKDYKPAGKSIEYDWETVANNIGGLGYAYATSKKYGPQGDAADRERLKRAMYRAITAYTEAVPVEGADVMIDGKPIGNCTGDGFANLRLHGLIEEQVVTHQWVISDGLIAPAVQLMPDMLADIKKGDPQAYRVYYDLVRFYQTAMAEVANRRNVNDPAERWGKLTDTLRSSGAWADANLGHRSRMMLALPIIWADYNRPMTYVQYWYSDYYNNRPFKNFSFSPGWSPHGIVFDVARWMTKYNVPAHQYIQSGFQPDGTVSHHVGNATDAAMVAYGFEWLTDCLVGFNQFKDTDFKLASNYYQFPADRLERVYPKLIYKGRFDFLVSGRSYLEDLKKFVTNTYLPAIADLKQAESDDTKLSNQPALDQLYQQIKNNTYEYSGTDAYWVNEFLVHRRGEKEKSFYASLKLKSKRTVGAEDFGKIRKSWYAGYGILPVKVQGNEYSDKVLSHMDWHALPGLTEEWRTDAIPGGHAQASLPGNNDIAGVTADGLCGMGIYHHLPRETYSAATAYKTYHFIDDKIISLGSRIFRNRSGQGKEIITTVDQSAFIKALTVYHDGITEVILPHQSVSRVITTNAPMWLHTGEKGYLINPQGRQTIIIKTGAAIHATDTTIAPGAPGYLIAISHGINPTAANAGSYCYMVLPNTAAADMPARATHTAQQLLYKNEADVHALCDTEAGVWQAGFFKPAGIALGAITVKADAPSQIMLRKENDNWKITMSNPAPAAGKKQLVFHLSLALRPGLYEYVHGGVYPLKGKTVRVEKEGSGSKLTVALPNEADEAHYNYQAALYNAAPVSVSIPR